MTGQYEDAETGLYYNRFRYYDAESGQYASQDPIRLRGSRAFYSYVADPLAQLDSLGLAACNLEFKTRQKALDAAYDRAGIPRGTKPDAEWAVGADRTRRGTPGYLYTESRGAHGHYMQFETERGSRVIAEHTNDGPPHFHSGQPRGGDPSRTGVDFGWGGNASRAERYQQIGEKHHLYYRE